MSLTYQQSLSASSPSTGSITNAAVARTVATTLANSSDWIEITDKNYRFYNKEYSDENYSTIDELKNIILDANQLNITQEKNSQYIPFQMPRYYDGFDLKDMTLSIYYVNKN